MGKYLPDPIFFVLNLYKFQVVLEKCIKCVKTVKVSGRKETTIFIRDSCREYTKTTWSPRGHTAFTYKLISNGTSAK